MGKATKIRGRDEGVKPTPEQFAQGGYKRAMVAHVESATYAMAHISAHDPVERWNRDGRLSDTQNAAIALLRRLWAILEVPQKLTASYGERIMSSGAVELRAMQEIEAREDLHRIQDYVPGRYWSVFENVCRHGMASGQAGEALGYGSRSAKDRAHTVVCFVCDVIAMKERL